MTTGAGSGARDPDLRTRVRDKKTWDDPQRLEELAKLATLQNELSPRLAALLARVAVLGGRYRAAAADVPAGITVDFWLNYDLGKHLIVKKPAK